MKNALILHGTNGSPTENWFEWLRQELVKDGYSVTVPELPMASRPNIDRYNNFLLNEIKYNLNQNTILVGHSSGAVAILGLLEAIPSDKKVDACYLVGAFKNDLSWEALSDLFTKPLDFQNIKSKAKKFVFIHSDNDPYCPLEHAQFLAEQLDGELIIKKGQQHFSVGTMGDQYQQFPFLLDLIKKDQYESHQ